MSGTRTIHAIKGGLALTRRASLATDSGIAIMPVPKRLVLPLRQHIGLSAEPLVAIGDRVLGGQMLAQASGAISGAIHVGTSGTVVAIESAPVADATRLHDTCIIIETDGCDEQLPRLKRDHDYHLDEPARLRHAVAQAGITGLGGATFPTAVKLAAEVDTRLQTLIINGAECDPSIGCDDALMREHAGDIIEGARCMLHILQINHCIVAVKADKLRAADAMRAALDEINDERLEFAMVPARYPQGGERQLIAALSGQEVPSGGLPLDIGFLCHNVATALAVYRAIQFDEPLTSRVVSVCGGGVAQPANLRVLLGTPVRDVIASCGGYQGAPDRLIMGGEMMGTALATDDVPVTKACNALTVFAPQEIDAPAPTNPCIRCGECALVCPASLLPQQLHWHATGGEPDRAVALHLFDCIECGCCDLACPSQIPLTEQFRRAKADVRAREFGRNKARHARDRYEHRLARLERDKNERQAQRKARTTPTAAVTPEARRKREIQAAVARAKAQRAQRDRDV